MFFTSLSDRGMITIPYNNVGAPTEFHRQHLTLVCNPGYVIPQLESL